jgi:hypothetical protein
MGAWAAEPFIRRYPAVGAALTTKSPLQPTRFTLIGKDQAMACVLNVQQVAVLRWINDGCPEGVMEGEAHKVSAAALRSRDLISPKGVSPPSEHEGNDPKDSVLTQAR